jgi:hypothetical protein
MKKIIAIIIVIIYVNNISAQNVGIGNSVPLMRLHVTKPDSAVALFENTQTLNTNVSNAIYFKTGSGIVPYTGAIKTIGESVNTARMGLYTYASTSPNLLLERLSITDVGKVGIGTINPFMKLHIQSADSAVALFENKQSLGANVSNALYFKTGSGLFSYTGAIKTIGEGTNAARMGLFTLASASANNIQERMSITDGGNIGMGITTPQTALHINPNAAGSLLIGTNKNAGGYTNVEMGISTQSNGYGYVQATKASGTSYGSLSLNPNGGNVGVGTTTPNATLDVHGSVAMPIKIVSLDYTVQNGDYTIVVNMKESNSYDLYITLPPAATNGGRIINIIADSLVNLGYGPYNNGSPLGYVRIKDANGQSVYHNLYYTHKFETHIAGGSGNTVNTTFTSSRRRVTLQCTGGISGQWFAITDDYASSEDQDQY